MDRLVQADQFVEQQALSGATPEGRGLIIRRPVVVPAETFVVAMRQVELGIEQDPAIAELGYHLTETRELIRLQVAWAEDDGPSLPTLDERAAVIHHPIAELQIKIHGAFPVA